MIDPITTYSVIKPLAWLDVAQAAPIHLLAVNTTDRARFQDALRPPLETPITSPKAMVSESWVGRPLTPGDAILQSLDKIRSGYWNLAIQIETAVRQPNLSPQALLSLQMQVSQVTLNTQLVHQVANTVEQHINTLLKGS